MREFKLPDVGEGVAEGELVQWLVSVGDRVEEDQPVAEVETDKALVEVPSPVDGVVSEIRAEEGEVVPVGDVIIVFEEDDEDAESGGLNAGEATETDTGDGSGPAESTEGTTAGGEAETSTAEDESEVATGGEDQVFAPPHVRRLARELDVDLTAIEGSGPSGRITEGDVRSAAESETEGEAEPAGAETTAETSSEGAATVETADRYRTLAAPATRRVAEELGVDIDRVPAVEERDGEAFVTEEAVREFAAAETRAEEAEAATAEAEAAEVTPEAGRGTEATEGEPAETTVGGVEAAEERIPYRGLRRTIGEQMQESAFTAPHATHHDVADATRLVEARERLKPEAEEQGIKLTYTPFVLKAVVEGLKEYPALNAELDEESEEIVRKKYYNIGVATATEAGLMVPVVKNVDQKGLLQIASEVNELAEKARDRAISREEMQGGTFTITNFGAIGGEYATPIINHPEVAILGLGAIEKRPHVVEDEVVARHTLPLSLSIDHRVVDGAESAGFTNSVIEYVEEPMRLLLE